MVGTGCPDIPSHVTLGVCECFLGEINTWVSKLSKAQTALRNVGQPHAIS